MYVYLLHFEKPLSHAEHYSGSTFNVRKRLQRHANGHGSRLTRAIMERGIGWQLAALWQTSHVNSRWAERHLKDQKNGPRYCPICNEAPPKLTGCNNYPLDEVRDVIGIGLTSQDYTPIDNSIVVRVAEERDATWIRHLMERDRESLGFIPVGKDSTSGLYPQIAKGMVLVAELNQYHAGYVVYGTSTQGFAKGQTRLQVHQACVADEARLCGVGKLMIERLTSIYQMPMIAKVRTDLPAVKFWEACGWTPGEPTKHKTSGNLITTFTRNGE